MSFRLAPMDFLIRLLTLALLALPPLFLAIALLGNRLLLAPTALLVAIYVWIWLWFRPTRFVVQARVLEIVWPVRRREIPRDDIATVRLLDKHQLRQESGARCASAPAGSEADSAGCGPRSAVSCGCTSRGPTAWSGSSVAATGRG